MHETKAYLALYARQLRAIAHQLRRRAHAIDREAASLEHSAGVDGRTMRERRDDDIARSTAGVMELAAKWKISAGRVSQIRAMRRRSDDDDT